MSMYIRLKRKNQTVMLHVEPSSTFQQIKVRLAENFDMDPNNIVLWANDKRRELVDLATVSDQEIKNDDVVYMCFPKENGGGFEEPNADVLAQMSESKEEKP